MRVSCRAQNKYIHFPIPGYFIFNIYTYTSSNSLSSALFIFSKVTKWTLSSCSNPRVTYPRWPQMTTCPPLDWSLLPEEPLLHSVEYGIQILIHWKWIPFQQKLCDFEGVAGPLGTSLEALRKEERTSHKCHNVHQYNFSAKYTQHPIHTHLILSLFSLVLGGWWGGRVGYIFLAIFFQNYFVECYKVL